MLSKDKKGGKGNNKMSFFDYFTEVMGWMQIVVSPLLLGLVIAVFIYFPDPTSLRLIIAIGVAIIGLIVGIVFATKIWRKQGTISFLSSIMSTPEFDDLDEEKKTKNES